MIKVDFNFGKNNSNLCINQEIIQMHMFLSLNQINKD